MYNVQPENRNRNRNRLVRGPVVCIHANEQVQPIC